MPNNNAGAETPFLTDVATLRQRAREHIKAGAVTSNYGADPVVVCKVLNEALATEIVCVLRYKRHYFMAQGIASDSVKAEFAQHATEEQGHADQIAERIVQLGGEPDLNPDTLTKRSHAEYVEGQSLSTCCARTSWPSASRSRAIARSPNGCTARIRRPSG